MWVEGRIKVNDFPAYLDLIALNLIFPSLKAG